MNKALGLFMPASVAVMLFAASCSGGKAKVSGSFVGLESQKISLEQVGTGGVVVVDSTTTDSNGDFKFRIALPDAQPTIYNLRVNNEIIPLFISPGERVTVSSLYGNSRRYIVEGSKESQLVKEINDILFDGSERLDSIASSLPLYESDENARKELLQEYTREYQRIKREQIRFIITNSGSLASIYALYQRLPGDEALFNGANDIVYYRMVADSVSLHYPDSPYLSTLKGVINEFEASEELIRQINAQLESPVPFPDIVLTDIYNDKRKLSDEFGKVILLDFWMAGDAQGAVLNAEYKEVYNQYSRRGFEIYQVNAGTSKQVWVNNVLDQKLPWISVSDMKGAAGTAFMIYNVRQLPTNYLISAEGDIVARDIYGDDLSDAVERLTRRLR